MATQEPVLVQINFDGPSSSNKTGWRRAASDGGAQLKADSSGGKSPGKSRKFGSLFRKSSKDDLQSGSGKSERASGRGRRKTSKESKGSSSRDSSLDGLSSDNESRHRVANNADTTDGRMPTAVSAGVASASKPPLANTRAREFVVSDSQDPEQRSASDLPAKKIQKINKELTKQNKELSKDVDSLKKDKETLLLEKQKLKSENKTLERELRKVSSKGDIQRLLKNGPTESDAEIAAEQRMLEREGKIDRLKKRLRTTLEYMQQSEDELLEDEMSPEMEKRKIKQTSGGIWESESSSALRKENMELRSKISSLEAELEQLAKGSSPKMSRIKTGNLFRRSKRSGGDIKLAQSSNDRPRSPDIPLSGLLTFDTPSSSIEGTPIHKSLPTTRVSPNNSPKFDAKDRRNSEIHALQSRLRISNEEKKKFEEQSRALEAELCEVKRQLKQLQKKTDEESHASDELERIKKSLKLANSEKTSLSGQVQHLRKEVDDLKAGKRSLERNTTDSLKKKENKIEELELDCRRAKTDCEKLRKELDSMRGSAAEVKRRDHKIEDLELERSKIKMECEKLRKELNSAHTALLEVKKKDSKIAELEAECTRAKKECEKLQKELDCAKNSTERVKSENNKATISGSVHTHTAAKPPSGARITSPAHSTGSKQLTSNVVRTSSSSVKTPPSPGVTAGDDSVFDSTSQSSSKTTTAPTNATADATPSKSTRKSSAETVDKKANSSSSPSRSRDSSNPPVLRRRRSSTELIELFENPPEVKKAAETNVKRNTSYAHLATSNTHRAKVAATRAMFETKNEDTTSSTTNGRSESNSSSASNRSAYRWSWTGDLIQTRRSSYTDPNSTAAIPEGKDVSHSKSQSVDVTRQFKVGSQGQVPSSPTTTNKATISINSSPKRTAVSVAPTKPASLNLSSSSVTRVNASQQSSSSMPNSSSNTGTPHSTSTPSSAGGAKMSKITFKSSSTTPGSSSPSLASSTHREVTVGSSNKTERVTVPASPAKSSSSATNFSVNSRTTRVTSTSSASTPLRSPTTPMRSPTTPQKSLPTPTGRDSSISTGSVVGGTSSVVSKTPSYVPSYLRSNTVTGAETAVSKQSSKAVNDSKPTITRSNTAVTFTVTSAGPRHQSNKTGGFSTQAATPEQCTSILKRSSTLINSPSDVKKTSSLLDIPENAEETTSSEKGGSTAATNNSSTPNNTTTPTSEESVTTAKVMHRSPVPMRFQRRKREERPKTMYAGANRSETVSLVRLISKYQEQERRDKGSTSSADSTKMSAISAPASTQVPAVNGNASPTPAAATTFSSSAVTTAGSSTGSGSSTTVVRSQSPRRRPVSYYGGSSDMIGSGFNTPVAVPAPSNMSSGRKPKKARRSQTVALGGINRQSKKAMLLRWCQIATDHYDNVSIDNFGESFADGLAFCALLHHFIPEQIPYAQLNETNREQNFRIAFEEAEKVGIPRLLDVEDMVALPIPDWMSVMTYITFVYNKFGKKPETNQTQEA